MKLLIHTPCVSAGTCPPTIAGLQKWGQEHIRVLSVRQEHIQDMRLWEHVNAIIVQQIRSRKCSDS